MNMLTLPLPAPHPLSPRRRALSAMAVAHFEAQYALLSALQPNELHGSEGSDGGHMVGCTNMAACVGSSMLRLCCAHHLSTRTSHAAVWSCSGCVLAACMPTKRCYMLVSPQEGRSHASHACAGNMGPPIRMLAGSNRSGTHSAAGPCLPAWRLPAARHVPLAGACGGARWACCGLVELARLASPICWGLRWGASRVPR